jgi:hypothetical protein
VAAIEGSCRHPQSIPPETKDSHSTPITEKSASHQRSLHEGQKKIQRLPYISSSPAIFTSPYRRSADIAGSLQTSQLHGLNAPTLDPLADTYIWVKTVHEWFELIVQDAASGKQERTLVSW